MFAIGYLLGLMHVTPNYIQYKPSRKTLKRRKKILTYIKKHPYSSCREIATGVKLDIRHVNGILTALLRKEQVCRNQERQYYIAY